MPTPMPPEVLRALRVVYALVREGSTTAPPFEVFLAELEEELGTRRGCLSSTYIRLRRFRL